jgi:hypothetical protein
MLGEQAFDGVSISRSNFLAAVLDLINSSATKTDSLGFTLHLWFNRASEPPGTLTTNLPLSPSRNSYYLLTTIKSFLLYYITLRINQKSQ